MGNGAGGTQPPGDSLWEQGSSWKPRAESPRENQSGRKSPPGEEASPSPPPPRSETAKNPRPEHLEGGCSGWLSFHPPKKNLSVLGTGPGHPRLDGSSSTVPKSSWPRGTRIGICHGLVTSRWQKPIGSAPPQPPWVGFGSHFALCCLGFGDGRLGCVLWVPGPVVTPTLCCNVKI